MPHSTGTSGLDTGQDCLVQLTRYYGLAADQDPLAQNYVKDGSSAGVGMLIRAGHMLGRTIRSVNNTWDRLAKAPLLATAVHPQGRLVILAGGKDDKVLVHDPFKQSLLMLLHTNSVRSSCRHSNVGVGNTEPNNQTSRSGKE